MNILYVASIFPTEQEGGNLYTDLAKELSIKHKVTVLVAEGKNTIENTQFKKEMGVDVLRVKIGNMYGVSFIEKGISIITMQSKMKKAIKKYLNDKKYDLILFMAPPVTFESVIRFAMRKYNAKSYLMQKDIFPQNSIDIGIMSKKNPIYYYFRYKEKKMYNIASIIGCMSEGNIKYILEHNKYLNKEKLELFPNTIKVKKIRREQIDIRKKYGIENDKILAMYGGNFGRPQGVDFIIQILKEYKNDNRVVFFFSGKGTEKEKLFDFVKKENITNVITQDYIQREDYEKILKETDIGFIFLDYRFTIPNTPSRILPYFEYSIPVMAATDKNTDYKEILVNDAKAGLWCESNNIEEFKRQFEILLDNPDKRKKMGTNGRKYLEKNWTVEQSVKILEKAYNRLQGGNEKNERINI